MDPLVEINTIKNVYSVVEYSYILRIPPKYIKMHNIWMYPTGRRQKRIREKYTCIFVNVVILK